MALVIGEYALPGPDRHVYAEYQAIHAVLVKRLEGVPEDERVAEALYVLQEFQSWIDMIQDRLNTLHPNPVAANQSTQ